MTCLAVWPLLCELFSWKDSTVRVEVIDIWKLRSFFVVLESKVIVIGVSIFRQPVYGCAVCLIFFKRGERWREA